jgi:putative mycofactocin binding protein MftB
MACAASTEHDRTRMLEQALELHPQVALRPEPFGALAYHFGNRRLVFLKHPDIVAVANDLAAYPSLSAALEAHHIAPQRWASFAKAFESLMASGIVRDRTSVSADA